MIGLYIFIFRNVMTARWYITASVRVREILASISMSGTCRTSDPYRTNCDLCLLCYHLVFEISACVPCYFAPPPLSQPCARHDLTQSTSFLKRPMSMKTEPRARLCSLDSSGIIEFKKPEMLRPVRNQVNRHSIARRF